MKKFLIPPKIETNHRTISHKRNRLSLKDLLGTDKDVIPGKQTIDTKRNYKDVI